MGGPWLRMKYEQAKASSFTGTAFWEKWGLKVEVLDNGLLWKEGKLTGAAEEQICSLDSIAVALSAVSGGSLLCSSAAVFLYVSP